MPWSIAAPAVRAGKVKLLATLSPETAGVYAVYPSGEAVQLARTAIERLAKNAQSGVADE